MANYKTHITTSSMLGAAYAVGGYYMFDFSLSECFMAGSLCGIAGMLPDLDSNSGIPQREMLSFLSAIVPMLMLHRFRALGLDPEQMVVAAMATYFLIRFGLGGVFRKFTRHRGMWHSIPAALIAGLATFLVTLCPSLPERLFESWAVVLGFTSHLVLDEIYAVDWRGRRIRVKKSFGTALKWFSPRPLPNLFTYICLILLVAMVLGDQMAMDYLGREPMDVPFTARDWLIESLNQGAPVYLR